MNNPSDLPQRQAALDLRHSVLIQAPAGSGKTELLIQRYLKLLSETVAYPEEIIAITFTRKAAAEMRQRIIAALEFALTNHPAANEHQEQTRQLATQVIKKDEINNWQIIQNPSRLRILTIDAFSANLTKQLPILSQFGAQPEIEENIESLFEKASEQVLTNLEQDLPWNPALITLLKYLDNDAFKMHRLFISMLYNRDQWLPYILQKNPREALENTLINIVEIQLQKISRLIKNEARLLSALNFAAQHLTEHPLTAYQNMQQLFPATAEFLPQWQAIANLLLTGDDEWRKSLTVKNGFPADTSKQAKAELTALINDWQDDVELKSALILLKTLPSPRYTDEQWEMLNALVTLLPVLAAQLYVLFKQTGTVDYTEITLRALQALGQPENPTDLALALDYKIKHLLVDEFQDTSVNQYRLLEFLTAGWETGDGRTLFLVGDPMQSIYRFRKAEVGLFIKARDHGINQIKLKFLQLTVNFRSTAAVVEWNNNLYRKIFPKVDDLEMSQIKFSASTAFKLDSDVSYIKLHPYFDLRRETEALTVINIITQTYAANPAAKIAILVSARRHLEIILLYLKQHQLAYRAVELEILFHNSVIQDLLSLTKALLNLSDNIAWYAILRAPWCGLTLADLLIIKQYSSNAVVLDTLTQYHTLPLSTAGKIALQRIVPILKRAWLYLNDFDLSYLVESTWFAIGGAACITENDKLNVARFFQCLETFEKEHDTNDFSIFENAIKNLTAESAIPAGNFIEVMTIHKSKGLEFDVVLIPGLDKLTRGDDHKLLAWQEIPMPEGESKLLLAPIKSTKKDALYDYIHDLEKDKLMSELKRQLYVATTRAKSQLHLLFAVEIDEKDNTVKAPKSGSLLAQLWPAIHPEIKISTAANNQKHIPAAVNTKFIKRLASTWTHPLKFDANSTVFKNQNSLIINRRYANWQFAQQQLFGTLFHKVMAMISGTQISQARHQSHLISTAVKALHVPNDYVKSFTETLLNALEKMQQDAFGAWLLAQSSLNEYEVCHQSAVDEIKKYIIDKIIVTDTVVWIIDFKTAIPAADVSIEFFLQQQKQHYQLQLNSYKQVLSGIYQQPIRTCLYFPLIPARIEYE